MRDDAAPLGDSPPTPETLERMRRTAAALALASRPPGDLLDRVRARRAANERVILPTGGDTAICAVCDADVERERSVTAALCLTSAAPDDLLRRVTERRAAGERVFLPTMPNGSAGPVATAAPPLTPAHTRAWRRAVPRLLGVAAVALVSTNVWLVRRGAVADTTDQETTPRGAPAVLAVPTAAVAPVETLAVRAPARPPRHDVLRSAAGAPALAPASLGTPSAGTATVVRSDAADVTSITLAAVTGAPDGAQRAGLDSAARIALDGEPRRVVVSYTDPGMRYESASWRLAELAQQVLIAAGVAPERIVTRRVAAVRAPGLVASDDAVSVRVERIR